MKKRITAALALMMSSAYANIDRAGNVIDGEGAEFGSPAIFATLASFAILHFYGDKVLFKIWAIGFSVALVIGLARKFAW